MFQTTGFNCFSASFSPFEENFIAIAASQYYGLVGGGNLFVLSPSRDLGINQIASFPTQESIFSVCFSENHREHVVAGCGDGSIRLFNFVQGRQLNTFHEHTREVHCVSWGLIDKTIFASASWDNSIKLWNAERSTSLVTMTEHSNCAFGVSWSPHHPSILASCGGDGSIKIWDLKAPQRSSATLKSNNSEILTIDWNKYSEGIIASGSVDGMVKIWDTRNTIRPFFILGESDQLPLNIPSGLQNMHTHAVRCVKWSPFSKDILASASIDTTIRVWNSSMNSSCIEVIPQHTEFVYGLDWSLMCKNQIVSCSWDETVRVIIPRSLMQ